MDIRLVLDQELYFTGQHIRGKVLINNSQRRRMKGIRLTLKCRAEVVWWEEKRQIWIGSKTTKVKHLNDDNMLYVEKYVVGEGKTMILEAGKHVFQFSIHLKGKKKVELSSSMELPKGHVRYYLKAEIDWPWAPVQDHERIFSVINPCNLKDVRNSLQPATFTKTYKIGLSHKKIHIAGRLEKIGYVGGEEILLHVEIDNGSNSRITSTMIQLVEVVKYLSSNLKHETSRNILVSNELGPIGKNCDLVIEKQPLLVPPAYQSAVSEVEFLKIHHEIMIAIVVKGKIKSVSQRIIIGTLPTKHSYNRFHAGKTPPENDFCWPYDHLTRVPLPVLAPVPLNPDVHWEQIKSMDPEFELKSISYRFDHDKAVEVFDAASESESDEDDHDSMAHLSDFTL